MKAISGFSYEEVNPSTCADYVREYVSNSSAVDDPDAEYDLGKAGEMLYEYMTTHTSELLEEYYEELNRRDIVDSPFYSVPDGVLTDVCMACEREEA